MDGQGFWSLIYTPGAGWNEAFLVNLSSELVGILLTTVLITTALRVSQGVQRWLTVRGPRRLMLDDSRVDADVALGYVLAVEKSTDRAAVRVNLRKFSRTTLAMAKRFEVTRDLFATRDIPAIVGFITDVHTVSAVIESDCDSETSALPLTLKMKSFPDRKGRTILVSTRDYYTQMFFALDRLLRRYGAKQVGIGAKYEKEFQDFLDSNLKW